MGIPTDPEEWSYGLSCVCWDSGFTPDTLFGYVSGIKRGDAWVEALGEPQNGSFHLHQAASPCFWQHATDRNPNDYRTNIPGTRLRIGAFITFCFTGLSLSDCVFYFENELQDPTGGFYGGQAVLFQREPTADHIASIADIMELLNMHGRESRMSEVFPLDSDHLVAMIADQVESTRIRIKYNFT